jgi:hypothetical protein
MTGDPRRSSTSGAPSISSSARCCGFPPNRPARCWTWCPTSRSGGPQTRWELIGSLVDDGRDPDPVSVLNRAKHHPDAQALQPDTAPTPGQHHRLAVCLSDLYTNTVNHHAAPDHARDTLDEAYRRAFREQGIRMQQVSETTSSRAELTEQFVIIRDQLVDLWQRAQATTVPGWWRADPAEDTDIR